MQGIHRDQTQVDLGFGSIGGGSSVWVGKRVLSDVRNGRSQIPRRHRLGIRRHHSHVDVGWCLGNRRFQDGSDNVPILLVLNLGCVQNDPPNRRNFHGGCLVNILGGIDGNVKGEFFLVVVKFYLIVDFGIDPFVDSCLSLVRHLGRRRFATQITQQERRIAIGSKPRRLGRMGCTTLQTFGNGRQANCFIHSSSSSSCWISRGGRIVLRGTRRNDHTKGKTGFVEKFLGIRKASGNGPDRLHDCKLNCFVRFDSDSGSGSGWSIID